MVAPKWQDASAMCALLDLDGQLVINSGEAQVVRWIFEKYLASDSLGKIASGLVR